MEVELIYIQRHVHDFHYSSRMLKTKVTDAEQKKNPADLGQNPSVLRNLEKIDHSFNCHSFLAVNHTSIHHYYFKTPPLPRPNMLMRGTKSIHGCPKVESQ